MLCWLHGKRKPVLKEKDTGGKEKRCAEERTCAKKGNKKGDEENEKNLCLNSFASKSLYKTFGKSFIKKASQKEPSAKEGSFVLREGKAQR